ncbi:hypothetical protein PRZ48_008822 [Zasmidium cellare]|uniref:Piwi domain-containing protein n=1 Tax=Zasmidium cellare TaxID=395010 RepID=A0ABR0EHT4_ZASCE|nr:hypothetical protein PRZ48_008822 [Zasmidium cellare]
MAPKGKIGGKPAAQPAKGKAQKPHILCIRCPDPNTHARLDPTTHTLIGCHDKELWYGFKDGPVDLESLPSDRAECQKLLDHVQNENKRATQDNFNWDDMIEATKTYREKATYHRQPVYKQHLKHALQVTMAPRASASQPAAAADEEKAKPSTSKKGDEEAKEDDTTEQLASSIAKVNLKAGSVAPHPQGDEARSTNDPLAVKIPQKVNITNPTAIGSVKSFNTPQGIPSSNMPLRPKLATLNDDVKVLTNHFTVNIPAGTKLYEYHVNNIPPQATRAKKRTMILDMIEHDPLLWQERDHIATDCQKKIVSDKPLYNDVHLVTVNDYVPGTRDAPKAHKLELHYVACHEMDHLRAYVNGANVNYSDRGASDALNIALSKAVTDNNNDTFQVGSNRFYYRAGWSNLEDGLIAVRGYFSSIKPSMGNILLNVNTVTSPFYKAQPVAKYLKLGSLKKKEDAEAFLAKRRVYVNFTRQQDPSEPGRDVNSFGRRCKTLVELGKEPQEQLFLDNGKEKTVWQHLRTKYPNSTPQESQNYFTVNVGKRGGKDGKDGKYYMATQLDVLPGQPYNGQLSANATKVMIDTARRGPRENARTIMGEGMTSLRLQNLTQPLIASLGLTISQNMVTVPARRIPHTQVRNATRKKIDTSKGFWDVADGDKYLTTDGSFGTIDGVRVQYFFAVTDQNQQPPDNLSIIANCLERQWAASSGQQLVFNPYQRFIPITNWTEDNLKQLFINSRLQLAAVIFPDDGPRNRANYTTFRIVADQLQGRFSICINENKVTASVRNANKRKERNGQQQDNVPRDYIRNFAMKINLRSGNTNHSIDPTHLQVITGSPPISDTMILGADVTHPGAGSVPHAPSIAAVVGSIDHLFSQCPGSMRLNPARQEWIEDMKAMTMERLRLWYTKNGKTLPKKILYYRDGVGDSYLDKILNNEVRVIEDAWDTLRREFPPTLQQKVLITAVVVTKRHHTRLYPLAGINNTAGKDLNCPPGTVVDSGITHPYYFDFYLQSHNIPQGTAKPSHYMVIRNDMDLTPQQIQDLTYHLCYTYGRSTTSVPYAPHAYYADRLCERGRLYLKRFYEQAGSLKAMLKTDEYGDKAKAEAAVMKAAQKEFYRNQEDPHRDFRNPWHPNLDGKMFWM